MHKFWHSPLGKLGLNGRGCKGSGTKWGGAFRKQCIDAKVVLSPQTPFWRANDYSTDHIKFTLVPLIVFDRTFCPLRKSVDIWLFDGIVRVSAGFSQRTLWVEVSCSYDKRTWSEDCLTVFLDRVVLLRVSCFRISESVLLTKLLENVLGYLWKVCRNRTGFKGTRGAYAPRPSPNWGPPINHSLFYFSYRYSTFNPNATEAAFRRLVLAMRRHTNRHVDFDF